VKRLLAVVLLFAIVAGVAQASTGSRIAQSLRARGLSPEATVLLVAMLPIVELRGAIPVGENLFHLPLWKTLCLAVVGNMLPILLVVFLLERLTVWLGHVGLFRRFFAWLFARTRARSGVIARYEFWGLVLFVGIPLPMTGAWTGAVASVLMDMSYGRALLAIFTGVLLAATVVTMLSLLRLWGAVIAGLAILLIVLTGVIRARRKDSSGKG
jgi:uncharacterized membrane protein